MSKKNPGDNLLMKSSTAWWDGRYQDGLNLLDQAVDIGVDDKQFEQRLRGKHLIGLGKIDNGLQILESLFNRHPSIRNFHVLLEEMWRVDKLDEAILRCRQELNQSAAINHWAVDQRWGELYFLLAEMLCDQGEIDDAFDALSSSVKDYSAYCRQAWNSIPLSILRQDPRFVALCGSLPEDPELLALYTLLDEGETKEAITLAQQQLAGAKDPLAIYHALRHALKEAIENIDEHHEHDEQAAFLSLYENELILTENTISRLETQGISSTVYSQYLVYNGYVAVSDDD